MNKKDLDRLEELYRTPAEKLTDSDKTELEALQEKKEVADQIKFAIETCLADSELLKAQASKVDPVQKREEDLIATPGYALSKRLVGMKKGNVEMIKAADPILVSANDDDGGYLVPAVTADYIMEMLPTYGQARKYMSSMPVGGGVLHLPKEGTLPTWTWGIGENVSITSSKPTLGAYTMTPSKGGALIVLSNEMMRDPNINVGNYVIKKVLQARGTGEDSQFFNGSGSPFTGIFAAGNTFGNTVTCTTLAQVTYANLLSCVYGVDQNFLNGASWFFSRSVMAVIQGLLDSQNRPIFMPAQGGQPATLLGFPVVIVEAAPSTATSASKPIVILGNLSASVIGDVMGIEIKILTEATIDATNLAQLDLTGIRVLSRASFTSGDTRVYSMIRQAA